MASAPAITTRPLTMLKPATIRMASAIWSSTEVTRVSTSRTGIAVMLGKAVTTADWTRSSLSSGTRAVAMKVDGAPSTFIATARVPEDREDRVQSAVVTAFPNITAIPVREVLTRVTSVLDQIALAMRMVAGFSIVSGLVVMAGALAITRYQRLYQSVILKALGATRGLVARAFAVEYALLGAGAGLCGTALAAVLAWAVLRFALDVPWSWAPGTLAFGVAAAIALATTVG